MKQTSVLADNALLLPCLAVLCVVIKLQVNFLRSA